ncbi:hypothetical protein NL676_006729 [Syzygium grande]|nr:hypothetical protein NL676_006729 [Syzygium grande]
MIALRSLCTHKRLLHPTSNPASLASFFKPLQNPHFHRGVHSTNHRLLSQDPSLAALSSGPESETSDTAARWVRSSGGEAGSGPESGARSGNGEISEERSYFGGGRSSYAGMVGSCRSCRSAGTMKQFAVEENGGGSEKVRGFEVSENVVRSWMPQRADEVRPLRLTDVNRGVNQYGPFGEEVSRVLGGGLVPGSLILVGGDPGVGKSTLLLQMATMIAEGRDLGRSALVVYVSGEESVEQIGSRADRLSIGTEELYLYSSTDIEIEHVTKSGEIAGSRVLEHIVDVVLYLEVGTFINISFVVLIVDLLKLWHNCSISF